VSITSYFALGILISAAERLIRAAPNALLSRENMAYEYIKKAAHTGCF